MNAAPGTGCAGLCPPGAAAPEILRLTAEPAGGSAGNLAVTGEPPSPVDTASEPAVVWTVIVAVCFAAVVGTLAKTLPPAVEAWSRMRDTRRRDRGRAEDARIVDLSEQVDHLAGRVWTLEQDKARHTATLIEHAAWDQQLIHAAIARGVAVSAPPPLYPTPPTPPHRNLSLVDDDGATTERNEP